MALSYCSEWDLRGDYNADGDIISSFFQFDSEVSDALIGFLGPVESPILPFDGIFSSPSPPHPPPLKWTANGGSVRRSLSPQCVAARERRKKISAKTQELSGLIPRGEKMSTADMLLATHKYVRFLEAEISILQSMNSQMVRSGEGEELLKVLITSPAIQERLSSEGKCLVPKAMVDDLVADHLIQSNPFAERNEPIY